jgi:hypothetical protein
MIAPVNCNSDCDCAQRLIRCRKAPQIRAPSMVIPASLAVTPVETGLEMRPPQASKMKMEEILAVEAGDACALAAREAAIVKDWEHNGDYEINADLVARVRDRRHQSLVKAFRECDLDCGMWSPSALDQLANLALTVLDGLARPVIDGPPNESGDV